MFIHPTKTEVIFMSKTSFIGPLRPFTYESKLINCVSRSSCLGVTLDNKLSWSPHINQISCTFNAKITKLKRMKTFDRSTLESLYFKTILPSTTYCISLWVSSHLLSELEDSHIRAARLIHNLVKSIHPQARSTPQSQLELFYLIYIRKDWFVLPTRLTMNKHHLI